LSFLTGSHTAPFRLKVRAVKAGIVLGVFTDIINN
jgi:hypothetical protein